MRSSLCGLDVGAKELVAAIDPVPTGRGRKTCQRAEGHRSSSAPHPNRRRSRLRRATGIYQLDCVLHSRRRKGIEVMVATRAHEGLRSRSAATLEDDCTDARR